MKKKTAGILLGIVISAALLSGCGKNDATEAASESAQTEKEGKGEDPETEAAQTEAAQKEDGASEDKDGTEDKDVDTEDDADAEETSEEETSEEDADTEEGSEEADAEEDGSDGEEEAERLKIGVLLPDEEVRRWSVSGDTMREKLEEAGYEPEILYADDDAAEQVSQIESMVEEEVSALIIAPVDAYYLSGALETADEKNIPVFSYDELIMNSAAVSYYVAFDTRAVGQMIGNEIVEKNDLEKAREEKTPLTIEFFMGSPDDVRSLFLYNGVMEVLQSYLEDGTLVCRSGRTTFDDTGVLRFSENAAKTRFSSILDEFYTDGEIPDIICASYDGFTYGIIDTLKEMEILPGSEEWPYITGAGCEAQGVKNIGEGEMAFSIFLDRRLLAEACAEMVDTYLKGDDPEVTDYEQYDNGVKIIGTYTCEPQLIDDGNHQLLVDNGWLTQEEIEPDPLPSPSLTPEAEENSEDSEESAETAPGTSEAPERETSSSEEEDVTSTPTPGASITAAPASGSGSAHL